MSNNHLLLITEQNFELVETITEEITSPTGPAEKSYYIQGIFMQGNLKNKNGRVYPTEILARECARYNRDYISQSRGLGELGHPEGPTINLDRVSHKFVMLHQDGNNFIGKAKILTNQKHGKIAAGFLDEGVKLGVSSRGMGTLRNTNGSNQVQQDYFLATPGDIVHDPSAPSAFVNGIMEGKEWIWDNGVLHECVVQSYKDVIVAAPSERLEEARIKVFEDFMSRISKTKKN